MSDDKTTTKDKGAPPLVTHKSKGMGFEFEESNFENWRKHAIKDTVDTLLDVLASPTIKTEDRLVAARLVGMINADLTQEYVVMQVVSKASGDDAGGALEAVRRLGEGGRERWRKQDEDENPK